MSDRMSVTYAQAYLAPWSTGDSVAMWKVRAARTVVVQAERIERLQRALSPNVVRGGTNALTSFQYMYQRGELLPDDMEPQA